MNASNNYIMLSHDLLAATLNFNIVYQKKKKKNEGCVQLYNVYNYASFIHPTVQ